MAQLTSGGRRPLWIASLILVSAFFSLGFACAVPLAAFATIAALTLSRRDAFALVGAVWLANQIAGFAVHHYPVTASTLAWGAGLGALALLSTLAAQWIKDHLAPSHMAAAIAAYLAAFAVYEGSLFAISLVLASGASDYAPSIVGRIFAINAAAFAALFLVYRFGAYSRALPMSPSPRARTERLTGPPVRFKIYQGHSGPSPCLSFGALCPGGPPPRKRRNCCKPTRQSLNIP